MVRTRRDASSPKWIASFFALCVAGTTFMSRPAWNHFLEDENRVVAKGVQPGAATHVEMLHCGCERPRHKSATKIRLWPDAERIFAYADKAPFQEQVLDVGIARAIIAVVVARGAHGHVRRRPEVAVVVQYDVT